MAAKIFENQPVFIGEIESGFFEDRLQTLKDNINRKIEQDIISAGERRLLSVIEENKKKWFFKTPETLHAALKLSNLEFDLRSCLSYSYGKKIKEYELLIHKIKNQQDTSKSRVRTGLSLLLDFNIINEDDIEREMSKISNKILETA